MVFIVQDLGPAFVEGLWSAAAGEPAIDRADPSAMHALETTRGGLLS